MGFCFLPFSPLIGSEAKHAGVHLDEALVFPLFPAATLLWLHPKSAFQRDCPEKKRTLRRRLIHNR
jgi:hypothetical protein